MGQRVMMDVDGDDVVSFEDEDRGVVHEDDLSYLDVIQQHDMDEDEAEAERAALEEAVKELGLGK